MQLTGVIHLHSTHSYDGKLSLPELKSFLLARNIQFACMTEHTDYLDRALAEAFLRECAELSDASFVFVPGFEVPYKDAHVLHIGATEFIGPIANAAQLQLWRKVTPLIVLAHPVRNQFVVDTALLQTIDGVEIWNQQYDGKTVPRARSVSLLSDLRKQKSLLATGGLDLHRAEHFGSPLVTLNAPAFNRASIVDTLRSGQFTFGTTSLQIAATAPVTLSVSQKTTSRLQTALIWAGKKINALLFRLGIRLPRRFTQAVRQRL